MSAKIIDGEALASKIIDGLMTEVEELKKNGHPPHLYAVLVGDDPGSKIYAKNQKKCCEPVGIEYTLDQLPEDTTEEQLIAHVKDLNDDAKCTGVILLAPFPEHINSMAVRRALSPDKDVEGLHPVNLGMVVYGEPKLPPCTPMGVVEILKSLDVDLYGAEVVLVGHSEPVGKPIALLLLKEFSTVSVCHIGTSKAGKLAEHTKTGDILIVAAGKADLISRDLIKPGAIVIDVGINRVPDIGPDGEPVLNKKGRKKMKTVGDVSFDQAMEVASQITPVPGGVGPMTVAMLLKNTVEAAKGLAG